MDEHQHGGDPVQQVHPGVQRLRVPHRADPVAHGVLHHGGHAGGARAGRHQAPAHAAEGVHQPRHTHRCAVRRLAVAQQQRIPASVGVVHPDDQGADAGAGVHVRRVLRHGEAVHHHVGEHAHHRVRRGHRGVRRDQLRVAGRGRAAERAGVRGHAADAGAGAHHTAGVQHEPHPEPVLREPGVRRLPGAALRRRGAAGDPGQHRAGHQLPHAAAQRGHGVRAQPRRVPAHRQDQRADHEHRRRHQGLDAHLRQPAPVRQLRVVPQLPRLRHRLPLRGHVQLQQDEADEAEGAVVLQGPRERQGPAARGGGRRRRRQQGRTGRTRSARGGWRRRGRIQVWRRQMI
mmetsp:Transcript_6575/g.16820  ORF Transcript_6575/g.16820 Transcript_6575/m.16820 type:complete len:345 (+) Transcript_6575:643-1677(+)